MPASRPPSPRTATIQMEAAPARAFLDAEWKIANLELHGEFRTWDAEKRCFFGVLDDDGGIAGVANFTVDEGVGHLEELVVRHDLRGRGFGERLIRSFEEHSRAAGCHKLTLEVEDINLRAQAFYRRQGWKPEAVLRRHWHGDDFQVWCKWLDGSE